MKKILLLTLSILCLLGSINLGIAQEKHSLRFSDVNALKFYFRWNPNRTPLVSAHRGGPMSNYPENCIETFENALKYSPAIIECDIAMTLDSVLVLMHDDSLSRTTNGFGRVDELTFDQIRHLRLIDSDGNLTDYIVPTFLEVLKWAKSNTILSVDKKRSVSFQQIMETIRLAEAEAACFVICYTPDHAAIMNEIAPEMLLSVTIRNEDELNRHLAVGIPANNMVAFVGVKEPEKSHYELLHQRGIQTILGTIGNLDNRARTKGSKIFVKLLKNGADILATDEVILSTSAIKSYMEKQKDK
jgi:glycerophosphoryl diester phosphodiesterase